MEQYLSEIVDLTDLQHYKLNLIFSPCGSGKTTFAINEVREFRKGYSAYPMIYLIDSRNGRDSLKAEYREMIYDSFDGFELMTYACFGKLCKDGKINHEHMVIVCDELSGCIEYSKINPGADNLHYIALEHLYFMFAIKENYIIALDATPRAIKNHFDFDDCIYEIPLYGEPRTFKEDQVIEYNNLGLLLNTIDSTKRGLIYTTRIAQMQDCMAKLNARGIRTNGFWSTQNEDHPMTEEQIKLRNIVLTTHSIPDDVQVLVINKSTERSINIYTPIDYVVVNSDTVDTQIQARGRVRSNIKELYVYHPDIIDDIYIPDKYINTKLFKSDKDALCNLLGFKNNANGRLLKWTSVKIKLEDSGYQIEDKKIKGGERYSVIKK